MCVVNEESGFWSIILFQEIMWGRGYNYGYLLILLGKVARNK